MSFAATLRRCKILEAKSSFSAIIFQKNKSTYSVIHLLLLTSVFWKNLKQEFYYIYYLYNIYSNYNY